MDLFTEVPRITGTKSYQEHGFINDLFWRVAICVQSKPYALHSIDSQGCVDLAELKRLAGDKVCLTGNVNCALLQTGADDEVAEDVRRALAPGECLAVAMSSGPATAYARL